MISKYYVYELIDPESVKVFYVGKGSGARINSHERDARHGIPGPRFDYIRTLWAKNLEPKKKIVERFSIEKDAFRAERTLIAHYGLDNLTNIGSGQSDNPMNKEWKTDRDMFRALFKICVKSNGFNVPQTMVYCRQRFRMPHEFIDSCRKEFIRIIELRGVDWAAAVTGAKFSIQI